MNALSGVGIGFRRPLVDAIAETTRQLDWLEVIPENFVGKPGPFLRSLERARERYPVGAHGVSLSLGGPDPFCDDDFRALARFLDTFEIDRFTEHLSFASVHGFHTHDLLSLPYNAEAIRYVAARIREAQDRLGRPIDVENVSTYVRMPTSELDEGQFVRAVVEEAGCGLLLDVNNVFVSASNAGTDPVALLDALPLERTTRIHVAGHLDRGHVLIDDHGHAVRDEVWKLLSRALQRTGAVPILIEWDTNIPALDVVLDEADRARAIVADVLAVPPSKWVANDGIGPIARLS